MVETVRAGAHRQTLGGWGRYPMQECLVARPERYAELGPRPGSVIARGLARSYGDAALNTDGGVLLTERLNRLIEFDKTAGIVRAEAGLSLDDLLEIAVPHGWFPPVTPGTKFVTLGGCVAADVHGKNHHRAGTFGDHVLALELILADGSRSRCSPDDQPDLFWATVGGMGLTGIIGEVTLRMTPIESSRVRVEHRAAKDLDHCIQLLEGAEFDDVYTVAWIDCLARGSALGRSVVMRGHHAAPAELPDADRAVPFAPRGTRRFAVPFDFPGWALNPLTIRAFNTLYYSLQARKTRPFLCDYEPYFYPLDVVSDWNRMYGRKGFLQYQCVIPAGRGSEGIRKVLEMLAESQRASFLAVLKRFGPEGRGMLSFPVAGYTLALDIPVHDEGLFPLLDRLDEVVLQNGGRLYLAKDSRMRRETFLAMYPRYPEWLEVKRRVDPTNRFASTLSRRLGLES